MRRGQPLTRRTWLRLVGQRHDVQLWDAEPRQPLPCFTRPYLSTFDPKATHSVHSSGEDWIAAVLEPYRKQYLQECELYLTDADVSQLPYVLLSGLVHAHASGQDAAPAGDPGPDDGDGAVDGGGGGDGGGGAPGVSLGGGGSGTARVKEVIVCLRLRWCTCTM